MSSGLSHYTTPTHMHTRTHTHALTHTHTHVHTHTHTHAHTHTHTLAEPQIVEFPEGPCDMPDIIERTTERPVILTCSAFGIPPPSVQWLFQGMIEVGVASIGPTPFLPCQLSPKSHDLVYPQASEVSTTGGTTTAQLVRSPALEEHSGNYTCLASNELGSVNRTVQLELQSECMSAVQRRWLGWSKGSPLPLPSPPLPSLLKPLSLPPLPLPPLPSPSLPSLPKSLPSPPFSNHSPPLPSSIGCCQRNSDNQQDGPGGCHTGPAMQCTEQEFRGSDRHLDENGWDTPVRENCDYIGEPGRGGVTVGGV